MAVLPTGIGPVTGYNIERSLRFDGAAYLNRTFTTPTANTTWSWSCWLKRSTLATTSFLLGLSSDCGFGFTATDELRLWNNAGTTLATSTAVFRDPSAWYHVVFISNGTTIKGYVNNVEYLSYTGTVTNINSAVVHNIGRDPTGTRFYVGGYLAEVYFIDGSAKTSSDFGQYNGNTGVWEPKAYSGTYGNNGFYLKFADNSNTTATTLGKDSSGNGNNWTPNGFSVTAGAGNDSMVDSPTAYGTDTGVGGEVRGNYATLNPLDVSATQLTLSDGNLIATQPSTGTSRAASSTFRVTTGKWYFEGTTTVTSGSSGSIGIANDANASTTYGIYRRGGGTAGLSGNPTFATYTNGDVIGVAFDADARTVSFYKNGTLQGTGNYTWTGTDSVGSRVVVDSLDSTGAWQMNFGQRPFAYTAPSGFKALCTQNLPTPTIGATSTTQANDYMNVVTWSGNNVTPRTISGLDFQPDFVWLKDRTVAHNNYLYDAVRGAGNNSELSSNLTAVEGGSGASEYGYVSAFTSNGFTLTGGTDPTYYMADVNYPGSNFVGWNWNAGGSNQTISVGQYATSPANVPSIASTVRANTTSGFSIVTFTTNNTAGATVGHGCQVGGVATTPDMIIMKYRGLAANWVVYHKSMNATPQNGYLNLNTSAPYAALIDPWNNTAPSSTVITMGAGAGSAGSTNYSVYTSVAYCFAAVPGYSAFGSYAGNGTTTGDGPFIYTGFKPAFVMLKAYIGSGENWAIYDKSRIGYNSSNYVLFPNLTNVENAATTHIDLLSNGFKLRSGNQNLSSYSYIYAAFAEHPFKYSLAR